MKLHSIPPVCLLSVALLALSTPEIAAASQQLFGQLDRDGDGWLVAEEIDIRQRRLFDRLLRTSDRDRDGRLSPDEFRSSVTPQQQAKPIVRKQGNELPGADALLLMLARMDDNADGRIERGEVPEQLVALFRRIEDRLGGEPDGVLDRRELTQAAPALSRVAQRMAQQMDLDVELELALLSEKQWQSVQNMLSRRRQGNPLANLERALEFFRQLDSDGDGKVTFAELPKQVVERIEPVFARLDRNRDAEVTEEEVVVASRQLQKLVKNKPAPEEPEQAVTKLIRRLDRDGDRLVSRQEAPRRMAQRFDRIDSNGDGKLDREELAPVVETLSRVRRPEAMSQDEPATMETVD